ncbi:hypothetical protein AB0C51_03490 [Streptomyces pathocidini]|uniref:hypothetical protein n=1 Tax=Streptomyces pathocidini TaxID=1650571 RepID=UPI0033EE6EF1
MSETDDKLLWVAVPGGAVSGGKAVLRVLVVPRLRTAGLVTQSVMDRWPEKLANAPLEVRLRTAADPTPRTATHTGTPGGPDVQVWDSFFGAGTGMSVKPYQQKDTYDVQKVEPTGAYAEAVVDTYRASAQDMASFGVSDAQDSVKSHLARWLDTSEFGAGPDDTDEDFAPGDLDPPQWQTPDFHRTVSLLREHPNVLRALGLVFEVQVATGELSPSGAVQVGWVNSDLIDSPWTAYEFDGSFFLPASTGRIKHGMVDLGARLPVPTTSGPPAELSWDTAQFDVDTAVSRLRDTARSFDLEDDPDVPVSLPTLRSMGLQLIRRGRVHDFAARRDAAAAFAAAESLADAAELTADELVLGYRVDVQSSGGWMSLTRRKATYSVGEGTDALTIGPLVEEGHIKAQAATRRAVSEQVRADEVVARWSGWSLALPQPEVLSSGPRSERLRRLRELPYMFDWEFALDGILPELRFGRVYQLRARVADVTGGGLLLNEPVADTAAGPLQIYQRHEPVPPPQLALPTGPLTPDSDLGPGGAPAQLVIRSDRGMTVAQFAAQNPGYQPNDSRVLLPPATSRELAEWHGMLDGANKRTWELVQRATMPGPGEFLPDAATKGVTVWLHRSPAEAPLTDRRPWAGQWPDLGPKLLVLGERPPGQLISWEAQGTWGTNDRVVCRLAPGEQITVEVSSYLDSTMANQFVIRDWVPAGLGSEDAAVGGRHPMVTPPTPVTLTHAVRKPRNDPAGRLAPQRAAGATHAVLTPEGTGPEGPLLGIHPASTSQLDLSAAWDEWADTPDATAENGPDGVPVFRPPRRQALLPPTLVERDAGQLPPIRQEFGDTRHRRVTYTATAVSRYRQFFTDRDPELFLARKQLAAVSVKSSARPAPPVVLSATPSFRWSGLDVPAGWTSLHRTRSSGRLRVELARPWFTSGEGERLAAVVWPAGPVPTAAHPFVSWANRDPIRATPSPTAHLERSAFQGFSENAESVHLQEISSDVEVVPYEVWFEGGHGEHPRYEDGRWYADIGISPAASSYRPFVRLALGRYQPESLAGLALSPVVRTEMVQLLPDRELTVERTSGGLRIQLSGIGPDGPRPNRVYAALESCPASGAPPSDVDLTMLHPQPGNVSAWQRVPGAGVTGQLNAPLPLLPVEQSGDPLRVVVRETEQFDPSPGSPTPDQTALELSERSVFLDAFPL